MQRDALFDLLGRLTGSHLCRHVQSPPGARAGRQSSIAIRRRIDRAVWETPQILPFSAFVATLYDAAQHDPDLAECAERR